MANHIHVHQESAKPIFHGIEVVWYVVGILELLLAVRFLLKFLGASAASPFINFIYRTSRVFVAPFSAAFPSTAVEGSVFEWTTLLAMVAYWMLAILVIKLFLLARPVSHVEAGRRVEEEDREL